MKERSNTSSEDIRVDRRETQGYTGLEAMGVREDADQEWPTEFITSVSL